MERKNPCEFCEDWTTYPEEGAKGHQLIVETSPVYEIMVITSFAEDPETGEIDELRQDLPFNYCPKCGRKLNN